MDSYLFFGPPGSGKGTQLRMLSGALADRGASLLSVEAGKLLRSLVSGGDTPVKRMLSSVMSEGGLIPSSFAVSLLSNVLLEQDSIPDHILIDGCGRKPLEAVLAVEVLLFFPDMTINVFSITLPDDEVFSRLFKRGRSDDQEPVIKHRLSLHSDPKEGTAASLRFLERSSDVSFHTIDGVGTEEEVHQRILSRISL